VLRRRRTVIPELHSDRTRESRRRRPRSPAALPVVADERRHASQVARARRWRRPHPRWRSPSSPARRRLRAVKCFPWWIGTDGVGRHRRVRESGRPKGESSMKMLRRWSRPLSLLVLAAVALALSPSVAVGAKPASPAGKGAPPPGGSPRPPRPKVMTAPGRLPRSRRQLLPGKPLSPTTRSMPGPRPVHRDGLLAARRQRPPLRPARPQRSCGTGRAWRTPQERHRTRPAPSALPATSSW
jgi:hypothetical protein